MSVKSKKENPKPEDGKVIAAVEETIEPDGKSTKKLSYDKPLDEIKNETSNITDDTDENDFEDDLELDLFEVEEIPKSKIDIMFDNLLEIDSSGYQSFYAMILRLPDAMSDNFIIRCQSQMPLGTQIFSIRDRFIFQSALQKLNNNSGMRCAIRVCDENGQEIKVEREFNFHKSFHPVGIAHLVIPNPTAEIKTEIKNNGEKSDREFFAEMQRQSDERFARLVAEMNKPKTDEMQQQIMSALIPAMIQKTINPENTGNNNVSILATALQNEIAQLRLIDRVLPEKETPQQKTTFDSIVEVANSEAGLEMIDTFKSLLNLALNKTGAPLTTLQQNPNDIEQPNEFLNGRDESEILTEMLITELESENPLNETNTILQQLSQQYTLQFNKFLHLCKVSSFDILLEMLKLSVTETFNPFMPFLDEQETIKQQQYIYNERGKKMLVRLKELHLWAKNYNPQS